MQMKDGNLKIKSILNTQAKYTPGFLVAALIQWNLIRAAPQRRRRMSSCPPFLWPLRSFLGDYVRDAHRASPHRRLRVPSSSPEGRSDGGWQIASLFFLASSSSLAAPQSPDFYHLRVHFPKAGCWEVAHRIPPDTRRPQGPCRPQDGPGPALLRRVPPSKFGKCWAH